MSNPTGKVRSTWADLDTSCSSEDGSFGSERDFLFLIKDLKLSDDLSLDPSEIDNQISNLAPELRQPSLVPEVEEAEKKAKTLPSKQSCPCGSSHPFAEGKTSYVQPREEFVTHEEYQSSPIRSVGVELMESPLYGPMVDDSEIENKNVSVGTDKFNYDAISISGQEYGNGVQTTPMVYNVSRSTPIFINNAQQPHGEIIQRPYVPAMADMRYQNPSNSFSKYDGRKKDNWVGYSGGNGSKPYRPASLHSHSLPLQSTRRNVLNMEKYSFRVPNKPPFCIWMGNMPASATHREIVLYFRELGIFLKDIRFGRIHINMFTCAYVDFHTRKDMVRALIHIDKPRAPLFMGRKLDIDINEGIQVDRRAAVNVSKLPAVRNDHKQNNRTSPQARFKNDFQNSNQQPNQARSNKAKKKKAPQQRMNFENGFYN